MARQHTTLTAIKRKFTQHLTVQLETNKYCYMCFTEIVNLNNPKVTHTLMKKLYKTLTYFLDTSNSLFLSN